MYKFFLAARYLRSRTISFVTIIGIFLSVAALIVVVSVMSGFLRETMAYVRGTMADIVVIPRVSAEVAADGSRTLRQQADFASLSRVIDAVDGVTGVAPRYVRISLIDRARGLDFQYGGMELSARAVKALGIDLERENLVTSFRDYLDNVRQPARRVIDPENPFHIPEEMHCIEYYNADFPCALVGEDKFSSLGLSIGDVITLATLDLSALEGTIEEAREAKPFEQKFFVAGAFRSGHFQFDSQHILAPIEDVWKWVGTENEVSEVYVSVDDYEQRGEEIALAVDRALKAAGIDCIVQTWEQKNAVFLGAVENERTILGCILGFFILIATFNVFATTSMVVTDKIRDIGILVSMGATPGAILKIFLTCGLLMSLIGSSLGAVGGFFFADNINPIKDFIERTLHVQVFNREVYNFTEIPVEIDGFLIAVAILITLFLSLVFSFRPALRASLMNPVETLRHE